MSDTTVQPTKREYSTPTLVTYGDVVSFTKASKVFAANPDGGTGFKRRTT